MHKISLHALFTILFNHGIEVFITNRKTSTSSMLIIASVKDRDDCIMYSLEMQIALGMKGRIREVVEKEIQEAEKRKRLINNDQDTV